MHLLFGISLVLQLALAAHAYRHGRTSPWVWIILFFPLGGSLLYAFLFLRPSFRPAAPRPGLTADERTLRRIPRGPFTPAGDRPDAPIVVASPAEIEPHACREDCPECGTPMRIEDQRDDTIKQRSLRVVVLECPTCGALPIRYFEVRSRDEARTMH